jgi:8-oxo-dGTP diphosphatase
MLMVDPERHILLFRFTPDKGRPFWATPGGACDPGERYEDAARREMEEETGWSLDPGPEVAQRSVKFITLEGEAVWSDERYFLVSVPERSIRIDGHTALEQRVMTHHHWWHPDEIRASGELIYPEDIADMVERLMVHG